MEGEKFSRKSSKWPIEKIKDNRAGELERLGVSAEEVEGFISTGLKQHTLSQLRADVGMLWYGLRGERPHTMEEIMSRLNRPAARIRDELKIC